jgi:hypothetical protein
MLTNDINNMRNLNACKYFEKILASFLLIVAFVISGCYFKEKKNKTGSFENTTTGNRMIPGRLLVLEVVVLHFIRK